MNTQKTKYMASADFGGPINYRQITESNIGINGRGYSASNYNPDVKKPQITQDYSYIAREQALIQAHKAELEALNKQNNKHNYMFVIALLVTFTFLALTSVLIFNLVQANVKATPSVGEAINSLTINK